MTPHHHPSGLYLWAIRTCPGRSVPLLYLSLPSTTHSHTPHHHLTTCVQESVGDQNLLKSCVKDFQDSLSFGSKKTLLGK